MPLAVLAVAIFVAFWVVLGLGMFLLASRRGRGPSATGQRRGSNRFIGIVFAFMVLGFGIALPAAILIGNHVNANAQVGGYKLTSAEKTGRELFGQHCAVCHTLAAANAVGKVGPNLDTVKPTASLVLHTINNGCLPNAPSGSAQQCLGYGVMPSNVVTGNNARDVANFVAQVAGRE
ncbi:MAG: c-type cytochrome [Solirubrobacteraceae bacterium]